MPRRPQDPNHSCDINIPATMPGTPITIDASENVRLKVLENRMVPKNTSHLDKPKEFDDFSENDYLYVSNDDGELRKFPIRNITTEKALDYTEAYALVVEDASKSLIGKTIDQLEASKFNRLPIRNAETFHLYIYLTEEVNGNRTTTGAFVCTAETIDIEEPVYDPTAHITAVITSAISLGDDFESITINDHKAPIINGNIPISIRFNGTEFATNTLNNKLSTELTATINGQEIPIDNQAVAKTIVRINGEDVPMDSTKPGVIDLDIDTRINTARQAEEDRATAAEDALANDLDEERRVRIENDDILQTNITSEETRAKAAEETLQTNINKEKSRAEGVEDNLQVNINKEATRATTVEANLNTAIDNTNKNLIAVQQALVNNINSEISARIKGDNDQKTYTDQKISDEANAREAADSSLKAELKQFTTDEINKLDVDRTGQTGSYIKFITEEDGKIIPELQTFATADSIRMAEANDNAPGVLAVKTYVEAQDKLITDRLKADETTLNQHSDRLDHIENIVPEAAGKDNILADRDFVNSSIATSTAAFFGTYNVENDLHINVDDYATEPNETALQAKIEKRLPEAVALNWLHVEQPASYPALKDTEFDSEDLLVVTAEVRAAINQFKTQRYTNLDYIFVAISESHTEPDNINHYERYKFVKSELGLTGWYFEYCLNNSGFTSDQWKAINSGVTAEIRENAVNDHNLIRETHTDGAILTKDENGNTVWENLLTEIPCKDESEASNTMAPTAKAVVDYVEQHFVDHLDSDIEATDGNYFNRIKITNGKLDNDKSIRKSFIDFIGEETENSPIAPQTKAVKSYVDGLAIKVNAGEYIESIQVNNEGRIRTTTEHLINDLANLEELNKDRAPTADAVKTYVDNNIDSLDSSISITDGYYFKKITIENGILQPVGDEDSNSQIKLFDDRTKLEEGAATAENIPSTLAVLEKFNSNGFIVCSSADNMTIYQAKKYNNCYIKYTGPSTDTYTYGDIYLVIAPNDGNKGWDTLNTEFNRTEDQKDGITTIKEATLGEGYIVLESESSATSFITGDQKQSYTYTTSTNINDSHVDAELSAKWNSGTTKTAKIPTDITFSELGKVYGISVNAGNEKTPIVQTTSTINIGTDSANTSVEYDESISFDDIRNMHYGMHTIKYHASCAKAYIKGNVQLLLQGLLDSNGNIFSETNNKGIASLWISYINRQGVSTYKRLKTLIHSFTGTETGTNNWYYYNSSVESISDNENGYEINLTDIQTVNDYKSISIICSTEAYKVTGSDVCYYYVWGAFTGLKTLALMKNGEVAQVTMNPGEVNNVISEHNVSTTAHGDIRTVLNTTTQTVAGHTQDITNINTDINAIELLIPSETSTDNQLADKAFVNSSISTATANFLGTWVAAGDGYEPEEGVKKLNIAGVIGEYTEDSTYISEAVYIGLVESRLNNTALSPAPTNNDYIFAAMPEKSETGSPIVRYDRFKCTVSKTGSIETKTWKHEYELNNSGYTASQWGAINSGITAEKVAKIHDIPTDYLVSAVATDDKLTITTNKNETIEFEGGKINTISVNGGDPISPTNKNIDITIPDAPVQSISLDSAEIAPVNGNVNIILTDKYVKQTEVSAPTVANIESKVGSEIGNVITKNDYIEETTYEEFIG